MPNIRAAALALTTAALAGTAALVAPGTASAAETGSQVFTTPGTYTWTVPLGVTVADVSVVGAGGGAVVDSSGNATPGGLGGYVRGAIPVTPGQTFTIVVGDRGGNATGGTGWPSGTSDGGAGGYGGGGAGGTSYTDPAGYAWPGAGGGGASAIFEGSPSLDDAVFVAGGGAGGSIYEAGANGGGDNAPGGPSGAICEGRGGTQTAGGAVGNDANFPGVGLQGSDGSALRGGTGAHSVNSTLSPDVPYYGGSGGGAGYYGGGGGVAGCTGGGGSSYVTPAAYNVVNRVGQQAGSGSVVIGYGSADTPTFTSVTPLSGQVGQPYSYQFQAVSWPAPAIGLAYGTLPPGLAFGTNGKLSGTPTAAGTYTFAVIAQSIGAGNVKTVTIVVNPATPTLKVSSVSTLEGASGTHTVKVPVHVSFASLLPVTVHWHTAAGTATTPSDYRGVNTTLTIPAGVTTAYLPVQVVGDHVKEADEKFSVTLTSPTNARIATATATVTVRNDD